MKHIINIGLAVPHSDRMLTVGEVLAVLTDSLTVVEHHTAQSSTEPTLVAQVLASPAHIYEVMAQASEKLGQDCVAVYNPQRRVGALVGPRSDQWGAFDMAYFRM